MGVQQTAEQRAGHLYRKRRSANNGTPERARQPLGTQSGLSVLQEGQPQRSSLSQAQTQLPTEEMRGWTVSAKSVESNCRLILLNFVHTVSIVRSSQTKH